MDRQMNEASFLRQLSRADSETFKKVAGALYQHLEAEVFEGNPSEAQLDLYNEVGRSLQEAQGSLDRGGLMGVVDDAFARIIRKFDSAGSQNAMEVALAVREIRRIVSGRLAFDGAPYAYMVIGPSEEEFPYQKASASMRAGDLQRRFRIACQPATDAAKLRKARGVILEAPLSAEEIMLAGEARGLGLEMVLIATEELLPGVPTHATAEAAFTDLRARCGAATETADPLTSEMVEDLALPADLLDPEEDSPHELAAWRLRAMLIEQAYEALMRSATFHHDRSAATSAELDKMIREESVPEELRKAYFEIVANGSRSGHNPDVAQKINAMRHKIEALKEAQADETPEPG
jgi:hypothetical protein